MARRWLGEIRAWRRRWLSPRTAGLTLAGLAIVWLPSLALLGSRAGPPSRFGAGTAAIAADATEDVFGSALSPEDAELTRDIQTDEPPIEDPVIKDAEAADHNETDNNEAYEQSRGTADAVADKPFQGKYWHDAIGVGGGAGGAFGGRFGGKRDLVARGGGGAAAHPPEDPPAFELPPDELWVIERPAGAITTNGDDHGPGEGQLRAREGDRDVAVPLEHTAVRATLHGLFGSVEVTQRYRNPFTVPIEATYVFPLPTLAAVDTFELRVGARRIRGLVREREEARRTYEAARAEGRQASLLTQERPNIFTQRVANLAPGEPIEVAIRYVETLLPADGVMEWAFPMVVGPRFNPPGCRDGVGAVGYGHDAAQPVVVHYLGAGERNAHEISLDVHVAAGAAIADLASPTHAIEVQARADSREAHVRLRPGDTIPNRDFVLRWRVPAEAVVPALTLAPDGAGGGFFALALHPPATYSGCPRAPMELVFVLDCSGSMSGTPLEKATAAIRRALDWLRPEDALQIVKFSSDTTQLAATPLPGTPETLARAREFLSTPWGGGGTMLLEGVRAALDFPHDPSRLRVVVFLTDGYIGNEREVLAALRERLGPARVFSFGAGSSPNRFLLEQLAWHGRGAVAWVGNDEVTGGAAVDAFFERVTHPALAEIRLDAGGWEVCDLYPRNLPDVFAGRPVLLVGRYVGEPPSTIWVQGRVGGSPIGIPVPTAGAARADASVLGKIWARRRMADLHARWCVESGGAEDFAAQIRETGLRHGLLCEWTAFVAVDEVGPAVPSGGPTVPVAVPLPAGMRPAADGGR